MDIFDIFYEKASKNGINEHTGPLLDIDEETFDSSIVTSSRPQSAN